MVNKKLFWFLILPAFFLMIFIVIYPLINTFHLSFLNARLSLRNPHFVGFRNYQRILFNPHFWNSTFKNTVVFMAGAVSIEMLLGFGLALVANQKIRGRNVFRVLFLVPLMISPIVVGLMGKIILDPVTGPLYYLAKLIGFSFPLSFTNPSTAMWTIIILDVYNNTPFVFLILLAGLQSIPQTCYQAADCDGASSWQVFRKITLPLLKPFIFLVLLFRIALSLQAYDIISSTTKGGPGEATSTLSVYVSWNYFTWSRTSIATAYGIIMFIIILAITVTLIQHTRGFFEQR